MAIVINGSGTVTGLSVGGLPDGTVDAGTLATNSVDSAELIDGSVDDSHIGALAASKLSGTVAAARMPAGSVLQVVQEIWTTAAGSTVEDTWTDLLSLAITPSSSSSKIYAMYSISAAGQSGQRGGFRLVRGSTPLGIATSFGNRTAAGNAFMGNSDNNHDNHVFFYLDSPSTTSATSYKVQFHSENTTQVNFNYGWDNANDVTHYRSSSTLTLMEIAG